MIGTRITLIGLPYPDYKELIDRKVKEIWAEAKKTKADPTIIQPYSAYKG